jgi:hypothetical protein
MNFGFWNFYNFYNGNRMFTASVSQVGDELGYTSVLLAKKLRERGHDVATLDMKPLDWFDKVYFIDYPTKVNKYFRELIRRKHPSINVYLSEPPIVRPDQYKESRHAPFHKVFTWKQDIAKKGGKYQLYHIPNKWRLDSFSPVPFEKRKLCVLINSFMCSTTANELYSERVRAARWFEQNARADFDLIGTEWDKPLFSGRLAIMNFPLRFFYRRIGLFKKLKVNRFPSYIGPNKKSKHHTLHDYRFCVAYENSIEPDYTSEKIWDSFFAGCIPIYLGNTKIQEVVPKNTFIDKRDFTNYGELYKYIKGMSAAEYSGYLSRIDALIRSPAVRPYTAEHYVENFIATET